MHVSYLSGAYILVGTFITFCIAVAIVEVIRYALRKHK